MMAEVFKNVAGAVFFCDDDWDRWRARQIGGK